jgi:hypothetical protein
MSNSPCGTLYGTCKTCDNKECKIRMKKEHGDAIKLR